MIDLQHLIDTAWRNNEFAQGGFILMAAGAALAYLRGIPGILWRWAKNRLLFTVEIDNTDQSFHWVMAWLASRGKGRFVQARARFDGDSGPPSRYGGDEHRRQGPTFDLSPRSFTTFRFKGRRVMAWLTKEPVQNSAEFRQTVTLQFLAARGCRELAQVLLTEAYELVVGRTGRVVEVWSVTGYGEWTLADRRPVRSLDTLVLPEGVKEQVFDDARKFLAEKDWYASVGVPWRRGYLLHGPAGSGKSTIAHVLASELGLNVYVVNLAATLEGGLERAMQWVPSGAIVLLEDIDTAYKNQREKSDGSHVSFAGLLNALDGVAAKDGRILIMTTNHKHLLDPALIRPGRADVHVLMDDATEDQARRMFRRFFPDANDDSAERFGRNWSGKSMAAIQNHLLTHRTDPAAACATLPSAEPGTSMAA